MQLASTSEGADAQVVQSNSTLSNAAGATPHTEVSVGGVSVIALVDSGSQSIIISRELLHKVAKQASIEGKPFPILGLPTVKVYGIDGDDDKRQLDITAQVELHISADVGWQKFLSWYNQKVNQHVQ